MSTEPPASQTRQPTALLIPSPWSGDENDPTPQTYRAWHRLYRTTRRVRHWIGLHDWNSSQTRCTWCGRSWAA